MIEGKPIIGFVHPDDIVWIDEATINWEGVRIYPSVASIRHYRPRVQYDGIIQVEVKLVKWTRKPYAEDRASQSRFFR